MNKLELDVIKELIFNDNITDHGKRNLFKYVDELEQQLQFYKAKEDKLREYISKNVFVGQELIHKEDTKNGFIAEVKSHLFKIIPTNKDFITNILQILNEGSEIDE